jgi:hypothetical protein
MSLLFGSFCSSFFKFTLQNYYESTCTRVEKLTKKGERAEKGWMMGGKIIASGRISRHALFKIEGENEHLRLGSADAVGIRLEVGIA